MTQIINRFTGKVITEGDMNLRELVLYYVKTEREAGRRPDLSYSDLSDSDLRYSDLGGSDLRGSNLRDSNLRGSNLRDSDLRDSDLRGSNLIYSDLSGVKIGQEEK